MRIIHVTAISLMAVTPAAGQDTTTLEDSFFNGVACVMDVDLSEEFPLGGFSGEDGGHDVDGDGGCSNNNNSRGSSSINNTSSKNISNFNSDKNSSSMIMTRVNSDGFAGAGSVTGDDSLLPPFAGGASLYSRLLPCLFHDNSVLFCFCPSCRCKCDYRISKAMCGETSTQHHHRSVKLPCQVAKSLVCFFL